MPPSSPFQRPSLGGRFEVEREVGRGAVGIVYRARDRVTGAWVAVKLIAAQVVDESEQARFLREGRVLKELSHPNIVRLIAYGEVDGTPYIAMEWLDGEDLAARTRRAPLGLRGALEVARQVALGLQAAHAAGVVHRDIKPSNIFLARDDALADAERLHVKVVDFGVALEDDVRLTRTGVVVGTPAYMAPEQARGDSEIDGRADVYALGASLFELIAGRPPHVGPTAVATLARLVTTEAPRLSQLVAGVPVALDELVARMLSSRPAQRPSDLGAIAEQLAAMLSDDSTASIVLERSTSASETSSTQGTRLLTSIVGLGLYDPALRSRAVDELRDHGSDAMALGHHAVVAHVGARRALGGEAARALDLALFLAAEGANVGVATGRSKIDLTRPVGEVVDRAAALAHASRPGDVLVDAATAELARGRFDFLPRGEGVLALAGKKTSGVDGANGAPFLGRDPELAQVVDACERCVEERTPLVVTVVGPPGIGKSRLAREALMQVSARCGDLCTHVVRSESFGRGHPLGLAAEVVRALLALCKGTTLAAATDALARRSPRTASPRASLSPPPLSEEGASATMLASERDTSATLPSAAPVGDDLLARLIANEPLPDGLEPRGARDQLWIAMTDLVLGIVRSQPTVIVLDDLQWADAESIAWVEHVLGRAAGRPLFALALVRPEFMRGAHGGSRFAGKDHATIELRPVSRRSSKAIVRAMLGESASEQVVDRLAGQAAGSPLFAEELARLTSLGRDTDAALTIEAAIQVSLDALDERARDALARLSVFGLAGWDDGLAALGINAAALALRSLAAADLVIEQPESRIEGAREWAFKHALVRDVAYATLGESSKRALHGLAGGWLSGVGEDSATVAQHFALGDRFREAAVHWERAARRALATHALADGVRLAELALTHADEPALTFARALLLDEAWSRLDPRAADREAAVCALAASAHDEITRLQADGARARYDHARGCGSDVVARLRDVRRRARELGVKAEDARCTATLSASYAFGGELALGEQEAQQLLGMSEAWALPSAAVDAWQVLAVVRQTRGELASALEARRSAARAARRAGLQEREAMLSVNLGFALTTIGACDEARKAIARGLEIATAIGSTGAVRHARMNLLGWTATFGPDLALDAELAIPRDEADALASGGWVAPDRATLGVVFYRAWEWLGSPAPEAPERARALFQLVTGAYRATDNRDLVPVALGLWALAELRAERAAAAHALASESAQLLEQGAPSLLNESPVYLALHDAELSRGDAASARRAIARGLVPLARRLQGLAGTAYAPTFLSELPHNRQLLQHARRYDSLPAAMATLLREDAS